MTHVSLLYFSRQTGDMIGTTRGACKFAPREPFHYTVLMEAMMTLDQLGRCALHRIKANRTTATRSTLVIVMPLSQILQGQMEGFIVGNDQLQWSLPVRLVPRVGRLYRGAHCGGLNSVN